MIHCFSFCFNFGFKFDLRRYNVVIDRMVLSLSGVNVTVVGDSGRRRTPLMRAPAAAEAGGVLRTKHSTTMNLLLLLACVRAFTLKGSHAGTSDLGSIACC
jgi:hypothetical protein